MFILRNSEILHLILLFLAVLTQNFAVFIYAHKYIIRFSFFFLPQNRSVQAIIYIPYLSSKKLIRTQMVKAMAEM